MSKGRAKDLRKISWCVLQFATTILDRESVWRWYSFPSQVYTTQKQTARFARFPPSNEILFNYSMPLVAFWKPGLEFRWHKTQSAPGPQDSEQQLHNHIAADTPWQYLGIWQATSTQKTLYKWKEPWSQCVEMPLQLTHKKVRVSKDYNSQANTNLQGSSWDQAKETSGSRLKYTSKHRSRLIKVFMGMWGTELAYTKNMNCLQLHPNVILEQGTVY